MSDEKKYTEREKVLAEREAIDEAVEWIFREARAAARSGNGGIEGVDARNLAATLRPLPRMTRPREVLDRCPEFPTDSQRMWRVVAGEIEGRWVRAGYWADGWGRPTPCVQPSPARVRLWADLLANPTEEVDAE